MLELVGNIWDLFDWDRSVGPGTVAVITTNGCTRKKDGAAVMGRGIAREALRRYPDIPHQLGGYLRRFGNRPFRLAHDLVSFPVKPDYVRKPRIEQIIPRLQFKFAGRDFVPGWACMADLDIIFDSATKIVPMADKFGWETVYMPRPGCGNGGLHWFQVKERLELVLDDRFIVCTY